MSMKVSACVAVTYELHLLLSRAPECWCTIDESGESWANQKSILIKGSYAHFAELRDVDAACRVPLHIR